LRYTTAMPQLSLSQSTRLVQAQKLTPQMIQAINLLSMPIDDLSEAIYKEVEKNPAIEIIRERRITSAGDSDVHQAMLEAAPGKGETLREHLLEQLAICHSFDDLNQKLYTLAERLIEDIDERGYFVEPVESLLESGQTLHDASLVLDILHTFDPVGVFVRDPAESLLVQARERMTDAGRDGDDEIPGARLAVMLLEMYPKLLETERAGAIAKKLKVTPEEVNQAIDFIRTLNPNPAQEYEDGSDPVFVSPDARIRRATPEELEEGSDHFIIEMNKGSLPEIAVAPDFEDMAAEKGDAGKFARDAMVQARLFMNAIEQRTVTVYNALKAIIAHQEAFFYKGKRYLVPMTMSQIAEEIGVHETTVSRIANGKFVRTEWGMMEIRDFFTSGVATSRPAQTGHAEASAGGTAGGDSEADSAPDALSKTAVKEEIRLILEEHEKSGATKKLSDQKLCDALAARGITVARRTVAKYRGELNIGSSYDR